jgi:hypothetical protein
LIGVIIGEIDNGRFADRAVEGANWLNKAHTRIDFGKSYQKQDVASGCQISQKHGNW